jgi:phosphocarrier protein
MKTMIKKNFIIKNQLGLHARAASKFVQLTNGFLSDVLLSLDGDEIDGKSIMCIISMGISKDSEIIIVVKGPDEEEAMKKLETFFTTTILEM